MRTNGYLKGTDKNNPDDKPFCSVLNTSKLGLALDVKNPKAKEVITRFYEWADIVFENFAPGKLEKMGFGYEFAKTINPNLIMAHCSIYGRTGPNAPLSGTDGMGSSAGCHRGLTGWPDREPMPFSPMVLGDVMMPATAVGAMVAALEYRNRTGKGVEIDVSMLDILSMKASPMVMNYVANGMVEQRNGNHSQYACPHFTYQTAGEDRWIAIAAYNDEDWLLLRKALGEPEWAQDPEFLTFEGRKANEDFIDARIAEYTADKLAEDLMNELQGRGIAAAVVQNQRDLQENDPLLYERGYYVDLPQFDQGVIKHMRPPFLFENINHSMSAAPALGQHTYKVCTEYAGMSDEEFVSYDEAGLFK